jgi:hypothetical protein
MDTMAKGTTVMSKSCSAAFIAILTATSGTAALDELPVRDGAYLTEEHCEWAEAGELDMVEFSVQKGGREIGLPSAFCIIATVEEMRENRYAVSSDCIEVGEPYQSNFILDVLGNDRIRIDGEDLSRCNKGFLADEPKTMSPADVDQLVARWLEAAKGCSGPGDDPSTNEACGRRNDIILQLNAADYCYGRGNQARAEFEWHRCEADSNRQ